MRDVLAHGLMDEADKKQISTLLQSGRSNSEICLLYTSQALDEYPMPDEQVSTPDMQEYGYFYDGMLPVTRERALELDAAGYADVGR